MIKMLFNLPKPNVEKAIYAGVDSAVADGEREVIAEKTVCIAVEARYSSSTRQNAFRRSKA